MKLNFISKQTPSLRLSHCGWKQVKSFIPSQKKGQRENSHTRRVRNGHPEFSFCGFGFTMIIYCIAWGWIDLSLSREDTTSVVWVWVRFGLLGHLERSGAPCWGSDLYAAVNTSLLCQFCFMGCVSVILKLCGRNWTLSWFLFSHEAI